jgi:hypothetical protein
MSCERFQLIRGDTVLGTVEIVPVECDFPWYGGTFTPAEGFAEVKPLFDEEFRLLSAGDNGTDGFDEIWEKIRAPGLVLKSEDGSEEITNVLIHIDGTKTWWR